MISNPEGLVKEPQMSLHSRHLSSIASGFNFATLVWQWPCQVLTPPPEASRQHSAICAVVVHLDGLKAAV